MHKLSDFEAGGAHVAIASYYSTDKRQVMRDGPVNVDGYADFITPLAMGSARHLVNFETVISDELTKFAVRIKDELYNPYNSVYWKLFNSAAIDTTWSKFGTASLKLTKSSSYCRTIGTIHQYSSSPNGWTEEFTFKTSSKFKNIQIFRGYNSEGYGAAIKTNAAGRLQIWLNSKHTGVWDISYGELSSVTMAPNTEYQIALEYDNSQYRLYVNGNVVWSKTSGRRISIISARIFGWSSYSSEGWYDEYRFSKEPLYRGNYTPATQPFSAEKSRRVALTPEENRPVKLSLSEAIREHSLQITTTMVSEELTLNNTNYMYVDYDKITNRFSLGSSIVEPQYGSRFDFSRHSLLTFDHADGEISDGGTGFAYEDNLPEFDEYGNQWIAADVVVKRNAGESRKHAVFNGTTSYLRGEIYALPKKWTMRISHSVDVNSGTRTLFSFGGNVNSYGLRVNTRFVSGGTFEYLIYLSSNGSSWNVASAVVVSGGMANNPSTMILSFDGKDFTFKSSSGSSRVWSDAAGIYPYFGSQFEIGRTNNASYYLGKIYEFSLEPIVVKEVSLFDRNSPVPTIRDDIHFFNITTMEMKKTNSASPSIEPDVGPPMVDPLIRLYVGEATLDAEGVVDAITYALNGLYVSEWYPVKSLMVYTRRHNIGTELIEITSYVNTQPRSTNAYHAPAQDSNGSALVGPTIGLITSAEYGVRCGGYVGRWAPTLVDGTGTTAITEGYYRQIITRSF